MDNNNFNLNRTYHFMVRELLMNRSGILLAAATFAGPLTIISLVYIYCQDASAIGLKGLYSFLLLLGGYIFTSRVFAELQTAQKASAFLMLPVSTFEKLIVSWFISSPLYVLVYSLLLFFIMVFSNLFSNYKVPFTSMFDADYGKITGIYLITQTIFFLGATHFKKNAFLKTILSLFLFQVLLVSFTAVMGFLFFQDYNGQSFAYNFGTDFPIGSIGTIIMMLLAIFFLVVSYFKLKEREI